MSAVAIPDLFKPDQAWCFFVDLINTNAKALIGKPEEPTELLGVTYVRVENTIAEASLCVVARFRCADGKKRHYSGLKTAARETGETVLGRVRHVGRPESFCSITDGPSRSQTL